MCHECPNLDVAALAIAVAEACVSWAEDMGDCHFCNLNDTESVPVRHGPDCQLLPFIRATHRDDPSPHPKPAGARPISLRR